MSDGDRVVGEVESAAPVRRRDPWPVLALWVVGLLVAAYLTFEHFTASATLVCSDTGIVNCASVTSSQWSYLFGIPIVIPGLLYMLAGTAFAFGLGPGLAPATRRLAGVLLTGAGVLFVLYLVWAELVMLGQICSWCTVVHVVTAALFVYYLATWVARRP